MGGSTGVTAPAQVPGKAVFETSGLRPLGNVDYYTAPQAWVNAGGRLEGPQPGNAGLTVRIGIDFGTAYTKVAIGAADRVFFVDWKGVSLSPHEMFLPGVVSVLHGGSAFLGRARGASSYLSDLKLPFLPGGDDDSKRHLAACVFLAWVMRYSRAWFFYHHQALCKGRRIIWNVNIGCPTRAWGDKKRTHLYEFIGHAAWRLSLEPEITILAARRIMEALHRPFASPGMDMLGIAPEFVAQIGGYTRSPRRRPGLHLLVDCGAGTVDAVTFYIHKNEDEDTDRYPMLSARVEPLGSHFLMGARAAALNAGDWDDTQEIPTREQLALEFPDELCALDTVDHRFRNEVSKVIQGVIDHTRSLRSPLSMAWDYGLPVFITGGASSCLVYREAVQAAKTHSKGGVVWSSLPVPAGAELTEGAFHRLSVAHGLTYDRESLGKVIPPEEIEDIVLTAAAPSIADRDEQYPK